MTHYDFFISWTGEYGQRLAEEIHKAINEWTVEDNSHAPVINAFLSTVSIGSGEQWRSELYGAL